MKATASDLGAPAVNKLSTRGFTLIELMIVVVIVGILAAIAYPSYQGVIRKGRRAEAKGALSDTVARLEQYYADNKTYPAGGDMTDIGYASTTFTTQEGFYQVGFSAPATSTAFSLQAVPQGDQANDSYCGTFTLTHQGVRGVTGSNGVSDCW